MIIFCIKGHPMWMAVNAGVKFGWLLDPMPGYFTAAKVVDN
jgi:hypothetical protein